MGVVQQCGRYANVFSKKPEPSRRQIAIIALVATHQRLKFYISTQEEPIFVNEKTQTVP